MSGPVQPAASSDASVRRTGDRVNRKAITTATTNAMAISTWCSASWISPRIGRPNAAPNPTKAPM